MWSRHHKKIHKVSNPRIGPNSRDFTPVWPGRAPEQGEEASGNHSASSRTPPGATSSKPPGGTGARSSLQLSDLQEGSSKGQGSHACRDLLPEPPSVLTPVPATPCATKSLCSHGRQGTDLTSGSRRGSTGQLTPRPGSPSTGLRACLHRAAGLYIRWRQACTASAAAPGFNTEEPLSVRAARGRLLALSPAAPAFNTRLRSGRGTRRRPGPPGFFFFGCCGAAPLSPHRDSRSRSQGWLLSSHSRLPRLSASRLRTRCSSPSCAGRPRLPPPS
ncbi:hypothetical protein NDU88_008054 [Pleurodeles waltl]|uniref:Uncharacterized protein n=1 Tax=Pleurodeles waltl TaxID=8319 RepID=A0AAV7N3U6_PLEWA|nr:hypothetical protein NDU88_008054 [Pleurodeles waltl]